MSVILLVLLFIFGFLTPVLISFFVLFHIGSDLLGAPFVPTSNKITFEILKKAKLKKGQRFLELGSGDGRVVHMAAKKFGVYALGVDIHPMLVWYAKLVAKFRHLERVEFRVGNFFQTETYQYDVVYMFLLPKTLKKLKSKLRNETKKRALLISHGFKIPGWDDFLIDKIERNIFSTYYYRFD